MRIAGERSSGRCVSIGAGVGLILAGVCLWGCESFGNSGTQGVSQSPSPSPVQHPMLQNIPLPVGFQMVADRSSARESDHFRWAQCEFEGQLSPEAVTSFYLNYMPSAKFTVKKKGLERGEAFLYFESDTEECNIRVRRAKLKTILFLDLGPLPKGSAEREVKPPVRRP